MLGRRINQVALVGGWATFLRTLRLAMLPLLVFSACTTSYDSTTDQQITTVIQDVNQQLTGWIVQISDAKPQAPSATPVPYNAAAQTLYAKSETDLNILWVRLSSSTDEATQRLAPICTSLVSQMEQLRALHAAEKTFANAGDQVTLTAALRTFNVQLGALSTYELVLKGGGSTNSASAASSAKTSAAKPAGS